MFVANVPLSSGNISKCKVDVNLQISEDNVSRGGKNTPEDGKNTYDNVITTPDEVKSTPDSAPDDRKTTYDGIITTPDTTPDDRKTTYDVSKNEHDETEIEHDEIKSEEISFTYNRFENIICEYCQTPRSSKEIREYISIKNKSYFVKYILKPLLENEIILFLYPDKKRSKNQKYITNKNKEEI